MERKLGISLYPEHSTKEKDMAYISAAARHGFSRIFTCLLSVNRPKEEIVAEFKEIINHAKDNNMEVILDVAPAVFDQLGISYSNLLFFAELGADGIRLDVGFDGLTEAKMTNNPYDYFIRCSERFKKHGIRSAAFITSNAANIGPWDINDGLCTLEEHRNLPIEVQAKHLWATGLIDDVIIGNAYASEEELEKLGNLNRYMLQLKVHFVDEATEVEKKATLQELHVRRGDITEYMVRSTEVRKKYKDYDFPVRESVLQERGQVVIGNNSFGKYKGELQIILKEMPIDERKNIVGTIAEEELFLLDYVGAWTQFTCVE
ncbi:DUF871 domain-containing protein [Bacillus toyonensis]|uniref:DUF871 domain-containing protein n=1 Tax=Bacillus TaxID=1386 RepID=UPI0003542B94|nr:MULTISPECIES: MupG family TIM beta-alpha barrel fold protein [Bacillus]EPF07610.1 hypothetical protein ICQ_00631 [Bacillus toyonensis]MBY7131480.1 DUF871 domain-containing protein [Bacillus sp. 12RED03]MCH5468411.1 MupG family TIM beta-alpha barrel fold protein [Bacillus toyonensis]MCU4826895.1 MupG family TIM beta-alpha barrel fold protein [Bacillus toyonensis]PEL06842.1 DUF871 domain-containing protein [Bacillus toyonensis]